MNRVLFVDDEPGVLDGLRLSLRAKRRVWEMVFVSGGDAALLELERHTFDVIVSDLRMPGIDGSELLSRAAAIQPQAARIVLTGRTDEAATARAVGVAHRFLQKPCDPETIEETIARALDLRDLLSSERIRGCVGSVASLPSLPKAYHALNDALQDDASPVESIARIIERDAAMASKVLQLVNSSFFGLPRNLSNVSQAVSYLGMNTLRSLVLAQAVFQQFSGSDVEALERMQNRSLLCARVARRLFSDRRQADDAGTAALLHDVGILALASRLPREHREHEAESEALGVPLFEVERRRLGTTHAEIGAYLLGLWGLPHEVIDAVAHHHADFGTLQRLDVTSAVCVATAFTDALLAAGGATPEQALPAELVQRWGIEKVLRKLSEELTAPQPSEKTRSR